jgi:hypothetical protein
MRCTERLAMHRQIQIAPPPTNKSIRVTRPGYQTEYGVTLMRVCNL